MVAGIDSVDNPLRQSLSLRSLRVFICASTSQGHACGVIVDAKRVGRSVGAPSPSVKIDESALSGGAMRSMSHAQPARAKSIHIHIHMAVYVGF